MRIWLVNKNEIKDEAELREIANDLPTSISEACFQYVFLDDKIRSVLSALLQHALVRNVFSVNQKQFCICRTKENKPFVRLFDTSNGNWNFNVSHHGSFIAIASSHSELIGLDIVDTLTRAPSMASCADDFINIYKKQLASREWMELRSIKDDSLKYVHFFILWALKESYIKAIGAGFGFSPSNVDFVITYDASTIFGDDISMVKGTAVANVHGVPKHDWNFDFWALDNHHLVAVARGPTNDAIPSYKISAGLVENSSIPESCCEFIVEHKSVISLLSVK